MTPKELAATVTALAALGLIAVGVEKGLDDAAKVERAEKVALELKADVYAEKDLPTKARVEAFEASLVAFDGGSAFVAPVDIEDGGKAYVALDESPCVIPDCTDEDGGWDNNHAPVDCVFQYPGEPQRWRGCNVGARIYASGTQCVEAACLVRAP